MMQPLPARFIEPIARVLEASGMWSDDVACANGRDFHHASIEIARLPIEMREIPEEYDLPEKDDPIWQMACKSCSRPLPRDKFNRSLGSRLLYNTASGQPEPGDIYVIDYGCAERQKCFYGWTNCDGRHHIAILPNGSHWDIDSRASNCTKRNDTTHRCWVKHGVPPNLHVDKQGLTCQAGAGSIVAGGWHGFLHHGQFVQC